MGRLASGPLWYDVFPTRLGWVAVMASPRGLRAVSGFRPGPQEALAELGPELSRAEHRPGAFSPFQEKVERYIQGGEVEFNEPLDLEGAPPFFRRAWEACRSIPPGETRTYAWLAAAAGRPGAARAAGQAMARNPLSLVIPCHRVIGSDGSLHGYGGGLDLKGSLLEIERRARQRGRTGGPTPS